MALPRSAGVGKGWPVASQFAGAAIPATIANTLTNSALPGSAVAGFLSGATPNAQSLDSRLTAIGG